mgnify:CR=1 FL=1
MAIEDDIIKYITEMRVAHESRIATLTFDRDLRDQVEGSSVSLTATEWEKFKGRVVVSPHPEIVWDWAVAALSNAPMEWTAEKNIGDTGQDEDKKQEALEYLCYGLSAQMNLVLGSKGEGDSWIARAAQQIVGGSYAVGTDLIKDEKGKLVAVPTFYDPINVLWVPGLTDMRMVAVVQTVRYRDAQEYVQARGGREFSVRRNNQGLLRKMLNIISDQSEPKANDPVLETNFYVMDEGKVKHAYMVEEQVVLSLEKMDGWEAIPVICGVVNSRGRESRVSTTSKEPFILQHLGRSILAPNRRLYQQNNAIATFARERARLGAMPNLISKTPGGEPVFTKEEVLKGEVMIASLPSEDPNVMAGYMPEPTSNFDLNAQYERGRQMEQLGTVPDAILSGSNDPRFQSALLQAQLSDQGTLREGRFAEAHNMLVKRMMENLLLRLSAIGGEIELEGEHLRKYGGTFKRTFKAADMPKVWRITPRRDLPRPSEKLTLIQMETSKYTAGFQSKRTTQENIGVRDPVAETEQRDKEELEQHALAKANRLKKQAYAELQQKQDDLAKLKAKSAPQADIDAAEFDIEVASAIFRDLELQLSGGMAATLQGQAGRDAGQPNQPLLPTPSPAQQSPYARGEGEQQRNVALAGRNNGT